MVALFDVEPSFAVTVSSVTFETGDVVIPKERVEEPGGTVTEAGPPQELSVELRETLRPPAGAFPVNVTTPSDFIPPKSTLGLRVKDLSEAA